MIEVAREFGDEEGCAVKVWRTRSFGPLLLSKLPVHSDRRDELNSHITIVGSWIFVSRQKSKLGCARLLPGPRNQKKDSMPTTQLRRSASLQDFSKDSPRSGHTSGGRGGEERGGAHPCRRPDRFQSGGSPTSARAESDSEAETELPEVADLELSSRSEDRRGASSQCCRR